MKVAPPLAVAPHVHGDDMRWNPNDDGINVNRRCARRSGDWRPFSVPGSPRGMRCDFRMPPSTRCPLQVFSASRHAPSPSHGAAPIAMGTWVYSWTNHEQKTPFKKLKYI